MERTSVAPHKVRSIHRDYIFAIRGDLCIADALVVIFGIQCARLDLVQDFLVLCDLGIYAVLCPFMENTLPIIPAIPCANKCLKFSFLRAVYMGVLSRLYGRCGRI